MRIRESFLPAGWYPGKVEEITEFMAPFPQRETSLPAVNAVLSPHAGWFYSGTLAALAVSSLDPATETVAIIGGHLPPKMPVLAAAEDGVKTPLGTMMIDRELRDEFGKHIPLEPDLYKDNTVEVLLPMAHFYFPHARLLWLRFPAHISSYEAGKLLYKSAVSLGRRLSVIASADLTHYGANFNFSPKGSGKAALDWVKNVNDKAFINAVISGDPALVIKRAEEDHSCCSTGAVLGAMGFASCAESHAGFAKAQLLKYSTSADINVSPYEEAPASFVGYAAIKW